MKKFLLKSLSMVMVMLMSVGMIFGCEKNDDNSKKNEGHTIIGTYKFSGVVIDGVTYNNTCAIPGLDADAQLKCVEYAGLEFTILDEEVLKLVDSIDDENIVAAFYKIEDGIIKIRSTNSENWVDNFSGLTIKYENNKITYGVPLAKYVYGKVN